MNYANQELENIPINHLINLSSFILIISFILIQLSAGITNSYLYLM